MTRVYVAGEALASPPQSPEPPGPGRMDEDARLVAAARVAQVWHASLTRVPWEALTPDLQDRGIRAALAVLADLDAAGWRPPVVAG